MILLPNLGSELPPILDLIAGVRKLRTPIPMS